MCWTTDSSTFNDSVQAKALRQRSCDAAAARAAAHEKEKQRLAAAAAREMHRSQANAAAVAESKKVRSTGVVEARYWIDREMEVVEPW